MAATGEQQPPGNQRLAPVQTPRALVAALRRSPALPLPRVLQSPVIGLAGASALQPQRKKRKAGNATIGATDGGSTDSPRGRPVSQWVEAQWEQRVGAQAACKHCQDYQQRATQQEQQQQQQPEVLDIQVEFNLAHAHFGIMAVAAALDITTRSCPPAFLDEAMELEQLLSDRMEYGHHDALYLAAALDPNFRDKHDALTTDQLRAAEDLAARLASADGRGNDLAVGSKETPMLLEVAQRVFCTPATSAGVKRLFSVFKLLWSDKRNRLFMGRMWAMAYVYFNTRALKRDEQPFAPTAAEEEQWEEWMANQPLRAPVA
ncbi:hypothetical protein QJQ45_006173 [Haematococcus lacustris]|nr:hypothetical protein QJQ45_006173 [Haematococcus lacustris]